MLCLGGALILLLSVFTDAIDLAGLCVADNSGLHAVANAQINCATLASITPPVNCCWRMLCNHIWISSILDYRARSFFERPIDTDFLKWHDWPEARVAMLKLIISAYRFYSHTHAYSLAGWSGPDLFMKITCDTFDRGWSNAESSETTRRSRILWRNIPQCSRYKRSKQHTYITDAQIYGDATLYVIREWSSDGLHLAEVITSSEAHAWQASCKPGSAAPTTAWS